MGSRRSSASSRGTLGAKSSARALYEVPGSVLGEGWVLPATSDQPQLWHRDPLLELQTFGVEHAFSCFMPVNLDLVRFLVPRGGDQQQQQQKHQQQQHQ